MFPRGARLDVAVTGCLGLVTGGEDAEQGCARTASALPAGLCEGGVPIAGAARALPPGEHHCRLNIIIYEQRRDSEDSVTWRGHCQRMSQPA